MIFEKRSQRMLKYEKAKAKLVEFAVAKEDYPKFQLNSDDLVYTTLFIMSRYCEELIADPDSPMTAQLFKELTAAAQYYDAAVNSKQWPNHDNLFLLLGAVAYFMSEDFGSAKVLTERINGWSAADSIPALLYHTLCFLLLGRAYPSVPQRESVWIYTDTVRGHFSTGQPAQHIFDTISCLRDEAARSSEIMDLTYTDFLYGVSICAVRHSAWILLPQNSEAPEENWRDYLSKHGSPRLLWPAQKIIVESGVLRGQDIVVSFPTGVGKTKSIELIVRSVFMGYGRRIALIVAPLRALCNEITLDMTAAFGKTAVIDQFTDTAQEDFDLELLENTKYILICTPEKFSYVLRHRPDILADVSLFIFDEAHLFDDESRGAQYELLVSEVVRSRSKTSQMILFSAVLSNSRQIADWLFHSTDAAVDHSLVKSTEKSIGFLSSEQIIHYYGKDDMEKESFFVPKSIQISPLRLFPKESKIRRFPEQNARDYAIYYGIKLSGHGGVAIFAGKIQSVSVIMRRIVEITQRGYDSSSLLKVGNKREISKLQQLIQRHYGKDSELAKAAGIGAFPHYSHLPNGVKMSIEYALRAKHIQLVVCTTTLAEGVNIPIKYLLLTTFSNGNSTMQIRKMQNLIGRTARSGIHTEGSAIVTNPEYFDHRLHRKGGGIYKWASCTRLFDDKQTEACGSAILQLVSSLKVDFDTSFRGDYVAAYLLENYGSSDCFLTLRERMVTAYQKRVSPSQFQTHSYIINQKVDQLERILENIETYLCYIYHSESRVEEFYKTVETLLYATFAFHLADPNQQEFLEKIFFRIADNVQETLKNRSAVYFAKSLYGLRISEQILRWTQENIDLLENCLFEDPLDPIVELFLHLFPEKVSISMETFQLVSQKWMSGRLYIEIYHDLASDSSISNIVKIEQLCANTISYDLSFFIGNIIDALGESQELIKLPLSFLQKRIKYGVPSYFQVLICENIFEDRHLAGLLEDACNCSAELTDVNELRQFMREKKSKVINLLKAYPEFFTYKFKMFIK